MKKIFLLFVSLSIIAASCVKQKFDEPTPNGTLSSLKGNLTVADLKKIHTSAGGFDLISRDGGVLEATVIADDQSGNYYKTLVIQDATGGMEVKINYGGFYNDFPIGRVLFIKVNGLTLGDYNGTLQLGGGTYDKVGVQTLSGIEQVLVPTYIEKGAKDKFVTPRLVKIADLAPDMVSTLLKIENVQFTTLNAGQPYADAVKKFSVNRNIEDCGGATVIVRSSGYASFASDLTPGGKGSVTAIYNVFGKDKQLFLRDPVTDVQMKDTRCDGTTGGGGTGGGITGEPITIGEVRNSYTGTKTTVAANKVVSGTVISDYVNKNWNGQNCIIQGVDGKGIMIRFSAAHSFALGDVIDIAAGGLELSEFNGTLQINAVPLANAKKTGSNSFPAPKKVTIAQVIADIKAYESTLIAIDNCAHTATKFGGNVNIDDKTGKMTLFTATSASNTATFAADVPVSTVLNLVGVAGQYATATGTTYQILMRNITDATKGTGGTVVGGGTGGSYTVEPIGNIRNLFTGTLTTVPTGKGIKGIVISDLAGKNINNLNCVLQGADGRGILVRFTKAHTFPLGESIEIDASNMELSEFNGLLQLNKVPLANVKDNGLGTLPTPKVTTLAQLAIDAEMLESTLVQINNVDFVGAAKFSGTLKITDDGVITFDLFTQPGGTSTSGVVTPPATFAANVPPSGNKNTLTAIVSEFTTTTATAKGSQLLMRNASDVK